jgi:hypothetical protein
MGVSGAAEDAVLGLSGEEGRAKVVEEVRVGAVYMGRVRVVL